MALLLVPGSDLELPRKLGGAGKYSGVFGIGGGVGSVFIVGEGSFDESTGHVTELIVELVSECLFLTWTPAGNAEVGRASMPEVCGARLLSATVTGRGPSLTLGLKSNASYSAGRSRVG